MSDERKEETDDNAKAEPSTLDWKDYLAFTLAAFQTVALPFILIAILIFVFAFIFTNLPR